MLLGITHYFGAFLLLAACVFLVVPSTTAPISAQRAVLRVDFAGSNMGSEMNLGTFGWCVMDGRGAGQNTCSEAMVGYDPTGIIGTVSGVDFSDYLVDTSRVLTRAMILHPIGAGLCFLGMLLVLGTGFFGSLAANFVALVVFPVTLAALICDLVFFTILRNAINENAGGVVAELGEGIWCVLAAAATVLVGLLINLYTFCAGRRRDRKIGAI